MALLILLLLLFSPICVFSQTLQESGSGLVRPSQQLSLTCTVSGFELTNYRMHWIRQTPGKGLECIAIIDTSGVTAYNDQLKSRTTITRDTSKKQVYLQMTNMQTADTGIYYCARDTVAGTMDFWGPGTLVTVTSVELIIPHVFPLIANVVGSSTSATFACLVKDYYPPPVSVTWSNSNGETLSGAKDIPTPLHGEPPAYSLFSQITVSDSEWKSKAYQCNVTYYSNNILRTTPKACFYPEEPNVHLLQGTCPESNNGEIELTCHVYNLTTQDATLKWYINDQERGFPEDKIELGKSESHFYALQSTVTIRRSEWNNGVRVRCQVTDTKTGKTAEDTIKKCSDGFNCLGINVFMVQPSVEDLYVYKMARISCVASDLKNIDESFSFEWSFPGQPSDLNVQAEDATLQLNGTYSVSSILYVDPQVWLQQTEFTCVFKHDSLPSPIITRIKKEKETKMFQPKVLVFPPSEEELAQKELYSLICIAYSFNPINIYMGWTENGMAMSKDLYDTSEPKPETSGSTYFMMSKLTITASAWDSGTSYGCLVGHEAIPMNFIRKSIDKSSGKPTVVKVSVTMSDTTLSCY